MTAAAAPRSVLSLLLFLLISVCCLLLGASLTEAKKSPKEVQLITEPEPGQEYVYVQTSVAQTKEPRLLFETAHKIPKRNLVKRQIPAGASRLNVQELLKKHRKELLASIASTTTSKPRTSSSRTTKPASTRASSISTRSPLNSTRRRIKKEADDEESIGDSTSAVLSSTTKAAPSSATTNASQKQKSRFQIKKGPNGQEYEYEYVYYYYDVSDEENGDKAEAASKHENNEVLPPPRGSKTRALQLGEEDVVGEERLPAHTRFPPRSRNLNTSPASVEAESTSKATRSRTRGRSTTDSSVSTEAVEEFAALEKKARPSGIRKPSLDLIDNASFNTQNSASGPAFPSDLPAGPVRFLGAIPNESVNLHETPAATETVIPDSDETITPPAFAMNKVAYDLYAISQGTQKLSGEADNDDVHNFNTSDIPETTPELTTEPETTVPTTSTSSTTTTTTTTTSTTTTTTTAAPPASTVNPRLSRFKGRHIGSRKPVAATTESTPSEYIPPKAKSKFSRPSFANRIKSQKSSLSSSTTEATISNEAELKPVRSRFGSGNRLRSHRTTTVQTPADETPVSSNKINRPSGFSLRARTRATTTTPTSAAPLDSENAESSISSTARTRRIGSHNNFSVRPLRPGPRLSLSRGRATALSTSTTTTTESNQDTHNETAKGQDEVEEGEATQTETLVDTNPLNRLRNRNNRLNSIYKPKSAASSPVQVRKINPFLNRRRPGIQTETSSSTVPSSSTTISQTKADEEEADTTDQAELSSSTTTTTTEEPRGLNRLLAERRRRLKVTPHF